MPAALLCPRQVRSRAGSAVILLLLVSGLHLRAQTPSTAAGPDLSDSVCEVREISRRPLVVEDSLEMHVPSQALVAAATGEVFLAGFPNYLFARQASGPARLVAESGALGVVLNSAGRARVIPAPIDPRRIADVRAVARPEGGWEVVFTEFAHPAEPGTRLSTNDSISGLWSGVFDGMGWISLTRLQVPADVRLNRLGVSAPVLHGDRLAWAVSGYRDHAPLILLLERLGGVWSSQTLSTAIRLYLTLAYLDSGELALAGVGGDGTRSYDVNSLFLWAPLSAAGTPRRIVDSGGERLVHAPRLDHWRGGLVLTWTVETDTGDEVWAATDVIRPASEQPHVIDPTASRMQNVTPAALPGGAFLWVTSHHPPGDSRRMIQLRVLRGEGNWAVARLPSPFAASVGAYTTSDGKVVLIGAEADEAAAMVRSLLVTVQVQCRSASVAARPNGSHNRRR